MTFILEQMSSTGRARARRMFGGYGIYLGEHFVAIVLEGKLYLKASQATEREFLARGLGRLSFKKKDKAIPAQYFEAPPEVFDDADEMHRWMQLARAAAIEAGRAKRPHRPAGVRRRRRGQGD